MRAELQLRQAKSKPANMGVTDKLGVPAKLVFNVPVQLLVTKLQLTVGCFSVRGTSLSTQHH